jgi:lipopolysaccharide/colanic/teichoic acid biosynthesis glycosyltransferase
MLKFRTMRTGTDRDVEALRAAHRVDDVMFKLRDDPRITRVGRWLRRFSLDELPQLFNVIKGDMSLVGPRPERPHFVDHLGKIIPFYDERHTVLPGITGWAQINYPYGASIEDARKKLAYDLYYIENRRLSLDLAILTSTVRVVVFQQGAR